MSEAARLSPSPGSDDSRRTDQAVPDGGLRFPFAHVPAPGVVKQVAPGIHWLRMPLPLRLNHVNLWLLAEPGAWGAAGAREGAGDGGPLPLARLNPTACCFVDTGLGDERTRALWEELLARLPLGAGSSDEVGATGGFRILLTHFHPDHSGAAGWLSERTGAQVFMSRREHQQALAAMRGEAGSGSWAAVERLGPHGLPEATREVLLSSQSPFAALDPAVPEEFIPVEEGGELVLAGRRWRVLIGYGHSPEHVSLYSAEAGVLISGDMLLPHISSHVGSPVTWALGNPVALFQQSLRRLAELPADTLVLPSHGVPFLGVRERVAALLEHHEERCARLLTALTEPKTAGELLEVLFPRGLDPLQVVLAMNETIAHLAYLEGRGDLEKVVGGDGMIRWVRRKGHGRGDDSD